MEYTEERIERNLFVPQVENPDIWILPTIKNLLANGIIVSERKIYSITFMHKGRMITETVGELSPSNNEPVIAIFEGGSIFYTCTPNTGVLRGLPMLASDVLKVVLLPIHRFHKFYLIFCQKGILTAYLLGYNVFRQHNIRYETDY